MLLLVNKEKCHGSAYILLFYYMSELPGYSVRVHYISVIISDLTMLTNNIIKILIIYIIKDIIKMIIILLLHDSL